MDFGLLAASEEGNEGSDGCVLGNWGESFVVVFPPSLGEAFGAESCFVHAVIFGAENPARFDDFRILWARDQGPGLILHDGIVLLFHGELPLLGILRFHCLLIIP